MLTLDEAATRLRVSRRTVQRMIDGNRLAVVRLSERRRGVEESELERYIAANRRGAQCEENGDDRLARAIARAAAENNHRLPAFVATKCGRP